ncbi:hypothetical protein A3A21_03885 [Candidatus Jorgensenbacteria bacterium RIFCSPLOWO2_01_FULL_45_25b]|uniref:Uncharacterized protein n=1 Tax=Candidatus Jorgensenbacteria bacterium RIFCSPLOWO2_01_FULL_45_25b TaxID=1798471 RepID=A0A1F6BXL3_9BACT|nr:MAG: hypothetical protein A3A21_03885 [Candidatus Jorgensenbacteria bacterium RIFCSPLOWO2_01_FULL_45_25b]
MFKRFRTYLIGLLPLLGIVLLFPSPAFAFLPLVLGAVGEITKYFLIFVIIKYVGGMLFVVGGYFTNFFLELNFRILDAGSNQLILTGWGITRDLANLGFVLVMIVIAIGTILRSGSKYGAQALLPKLIAAAILVNFSLTISGVVLDFSHTMTRFFFAPVAGISSPDGNFRFQEVVETISGAFNPQKLLGDPGEPSPFDLEAPNPGITDYAVGFLTQQLFSILFTYVAAFVLFALALMFLFRFIVLSFLLVLAPLTWLFWVVPSLQGYFKEWWDKFLSWAFFAPASAFFIYLALLSVQKISSGSEKSADGFFQGNGPMALIIGQGVKMVVLTGFLFGALVIAKRLGIAGAAGAIGLAKKGQKTGQKWALGKGLQAGTAFPRSALGKKLTNSMQKDGKTPFGNFAKTALGIKSLGGLANRVGGHGEAQLAAASNKKLGGLSDERLANLVSTLGGSDLVYALEKLSKNKNIDMIPNSDKYIDDPYKNLFARMGKGQAFKDMEKTRGLNTEMAELSRQIEKLDEKSAEYAADLEKLSGELKQKSLEFFSSWSSADWGKFQINDAFGKNPFGMQNDAIAKQIQEAQAYGIVKNNTGDISKLLMGVKQKNFDVVQEAVKGVADTLPNDEKALKNRIEDVLKRTVDRRLAGINPEFDPSFGSEGRQRQQQPPQPPPQQPNNMPH